MIKIVFLKKCRWALSLTEQKEFVEGEEVELDPSLANDIVEAGCAKYNLPSPMPEAELEKPKKKK